MGDTSMPYGGEYDMSGSYEQQNYNQNRNKTYEIRAGRFYRSCECSLRNGLQDSCPRTTCQGKSNFGNRQANSDMSYPAQYGSMGMGDMGGMPSMGSMPGMGGMAGMGGMGGMAGMGEVPYEPAAGDGYNAPMSAYKNYASNGSYQMPSGDEAYQSMQSANGLSAPNWNTGGQQQGGYPSYM